MYLGWVDKCLDAVRGKKFADKCMENFLKIVQESGEQWPSEDASRRRPLKLTTLPAFHGRNFAKTTSSRKDNILFRIFRRVITATSGITRLQETRKRKLRFHLCNNHEGATKLLPALEMTKKLEEKLQAILIKLEKLDAIEKSVKILQETLAGMDSEIQSRESAQASAYRDINDLKESLNFAEYHCKKTTASFNEYKQKISLQMTELEQKGNSLESKITELETKNLYLEAYIPGGKTLNLKTSKRYPI